MKITIISVGKLKEKYLRDAVSEYSKRLSRYCKLNFIELTDEKTPDNASIAEKMQIKKREGDKILSQIKENMFVIPLAIEGKSVSSEEFSKLINDKMVLGTSHITFIIGGSLGLSQDVINRGDVSISFSRMTFPHQIMKVILLEQVYRVFKIISGEPYHK
ncbi:MAG: 23S rRNA (pseudouridine(1915)-N(3))-methyltransferase RlmH [Suipraeoptans sp.]